MNTCTKCNLSKPEEEFNWKSKATNKRHKMCKTCCSFAQKNHYTRSEDGKHKRRLSNAVSSTARRQRNREFVWNFLLSNPCSACPETDPVVLEFDHRDPSEKRFEISNMINGCFGIEAIQEEIDKCDVLCANCHRRKTAKQFGWFNMKRA